MASKGVRIFLSIIIGLAVLAAAGAVVFLAFIYPNQTIDYIEIHGLSPQVILPEEANRYISSLKGQRFSDTDIDQIRIFVSDQGIVDYASVERSYPGSIFINITPKNPAAVFNTDSGDALVVNDDGSYFIGYEELLTALETEIPFVMITDGSQREERQREEIQDAMRYIPMLRDLKERAPDIYNLISVVKYDTTNSRAFSIGLTYIGFPVDFTLFNPISGVRLEEAVRAALYIEKSSSTDTPMRYTIFDTYMIESEI